MKKILEVLQYGDGELRFNTDLDVSKDPMAIMNLTIGAMFSMATKLWGGNEQTVIAVIRSCLLQIWQSALIVKSFLMDLEKKQKKLVMSS